jgi:glutamate-5-semialdehyde dehydrogenase
LITGMAERARAAAHLLAKSSIAARNQALRRLAELLTEQGPALDAANQLDLERARQRGHDAAFIDRLALPAKAIASMVDGLHQLAEAGDPIGAITELRRQPSGIEVGRMRVPIGVIGIVYEARPNVTIDAAALCIKSGNAVLLRGGSEALYSNQALGQLLAEPCRLAG